MTGNPILDKILAAINILGVGSAIGTYVYTDIVFKRPLPEEKHWYQELMKAASESKYIQTFKLDKMTINLPSKTSRLRYVDLGPELEPTLPKYMEILGTEFSKSIIKDSLIAIISKMTPDELNSVSGKIVLENRLKLRINARLGETMIKKIYFSQFVIQ